MLTTTEQKLELLAAAQIDLVIVEPFTAVFATTTPESFVRDHVHARVAPLEVYVGYDFHYGRDRAGSMRLLTELGPRLGFAVTEAATGRECIEKAKAERPDLILMDIQLPVIDGYEATRQIKADPELRHIPIIAVTSYALAGDEAKRERVPVPVFVGDVAKGAGEEALSGEFEVRRHQRRRVGFRVR